MQYKEPLELMGVPGSPYTRKMLALLRYRRIQYKLLPGLRGQLRPEPDRYKERPQPKVSLLPTFYVADEAGNEIAICDSTPLIRELDIEYPTRAVIPGNPLLALINSVIEDYADEWLTKAMFHYRWTYPPDIKKAGQMLPRWANINLPEATMRERGRQISELQISRLRYVGSNEITKKTIESSFLRFIKLLDAHLTTNTFLLGMRPASCDFAVYGQLTCLALFDPTPQSIILKYAPRIYAWAEVMEDLSGFEILAGDWFSESEPAEELELPNSLSGILVEIGKTYTPYLLSNEHAIKTNKDLLKTEIDGLEWIQKPFPYQFKCLQALRDEFHQLSIEQRKGFKKFSLGMGISELFD